MRRALLPPLTIAAVLASATACNTGFTPQYLVQDLRILAVRARAAGTTAQADVRPGDVVDLDVLVANPLSRPGLVVTWYGCLPQATEAELPCNDPTYLADPGRLAAAPRVAPLGSCTPAAAPGDSCGISVPIDPSLVSTAVLEWSQTQATFACRPYVELPVIAIAEAGGRSAIALKTVRVLPRATTAANQNPVPLNIVRGATGPALCGGGFGIDAAPYPMGRTSLCSPTASGQEMFQVCDPTPRDTSESFSLQWYVTAGEFPDEKGGVGNATGNPLDFERPAGAFTMWTILRDGRGGTGWIRKDVGAAP